MGNGKRLIDQLGEKYFSDIKNVEKMIDELYHMADVIKMERDAYGKLLDASNGCGEVQLDMIDEARKERDEAREEAKKYKKLYEEREGYYCVACGERINPLYEHLCKERSETGA